MNKFLLLLLLPFLVFAQIPNASFENWSDTEPDGWWTSNIEGLLSPVTQSADAFSGSFAIKGEVVPTGDIVFPPSIAIGSGTSDYADIDQRYTSLKGNIKFFQQDSNEYIFGGVYLYNTETNIVFASGGLFLGENLETYTPFEMVIDYYSELTPEKMSISFTLGSETGEPIEGTYFLIDNLSLSTVTGLEKHLVVNPETFSLKQNYPNPFNPTTKITYQLPMSGHTKLVLYDNNGRLVQTLLDRNHAAGSYTINFDGSSLPSGVYFYRLTAANFSETKRMLLVK